jgi:hypothetical protein
MKVSLIYKNVIITILYAILSLKLSLDIGIVIKRKWFRYWYKRELDHEEHRTEFELVDILCYSVLFWLPSV